MAVTLELSPVPVVHAAAFHVYVTGLVAGNAIRVNTFSSAGGTGFADTPTTGTADANGEFACAITAQAQLGWYAIVVEDTTAGTIVAEDKFNNT